MSDDIFRAIQGRPIFWTDAEGLTHRCEGATMHPGVRLIWTDCHRDVPANGAFVTWGEPTDCPRCLAAARADGQEWPAR